MKRSTRLAAAILLIFGCGSFLIPFSAHLSSQRQTGPARPAPAGAPTKASPTPATKATAPKAKKVQEDPNRYGPNGEIIGQPWAGEMGITETVDEIMERERRSPKVDMNNVRTVVPPGTDAEADREHLLDNPDSPPVASWPPSDLGTETDTTKLSVTPNAPQTLGVNTRIGTINDSGFIPPDTQGDVGPTQYLLCINGRIRTIAKSNGLADGNLDSTSDSFFNSVRNGAGTGDPRVRYDRLTQRWFVMVFNTASSNNRILIAVSSGPVISSAASFTFFFFQHNTVSPAGDNGAFADFPTMGVDANALYIGVNLFTFSYIGSTGFVVRKSSITGAGPIVVSAFRNLVPNGTGEGPYTPQGVDNTDPAATEGYFLGISNTTAGRLVFRRVSNPGGTPTLSTDINLTVPTTASPILAPAQGSSIAINTVDDRLNEARIHRDQISGVTSLWTAHNIQVNSSGVGSTSGGRNGARWYQIGNLTGTPTLIQSGTVFDSATSNPRSFYFPAVAMSGQGHAAIAYSFSAANTFVGAATNGRLRTDATGTMQSQTIIQNGLASYQRSDGSRNRWGDYSHTSVDPNDDMTMWTVQEYADSPANTWAIRLTRLNAPPPATPSCGSPTTIAPGTSNVNLIVNGTSSSGSGFFDPGTGFANRIQATVNGGGVTVNSVTFNNPTQLTLNISVSGGATAGARTITVTNPDGQQATGGGCLTIGTACANPPTTADAGTPQTLCLPTQATLAANTPSVGTGLWSVVSGPSTSAAQFSNTGSPTSTFTPAGGAGVYTLQWSITSAGCPPSTDTVTLAYNSATASAGGDQSTCITGSVTLAAAAPASGTGTWSVVTGPSTSTAQFSNVNAANATFTPAAGAGTYTLQWLVNSPPCAPASDQVVITVSGNCGNGADFLLVADTTNNRVQRFNGTTWTVINTPLSAPEAVTASVDGQRIYIADTGNNRVQFSTNGGGTWATFASSGTGLNQVSGPRGLALDTAGNLYVADAGNNRVLRFNNGTPGSGVILANSGTTTGRVRTPNGLAIDTSFTLFIADTGNNRVMKITSANTKTTANTGTLVAGFGSGLNAVRAPQGVAVDAAGNLYVADTGNNRVVRFANGNPGTATALATSGTTLGKVRAPEGVTISSFTVGTLAGGDSLVVSDTTNNRIQGRLLAGTTWVLVGTPNGLGTNPGQFRSPSKIR